MKKINKLSLPATILIASIILGGFIFATQIIKQQSIERQQEIKLEAERQEAEAEAEKEKAEEVFSNNLKCQDLLKDLEQRWNNVVGIRYSGVFNTCMVKYKDKKSGEIEEAQIENMRDVE